MGATELNPPEWFFREWNRTALLPARYAATLTLPGGSTSAHWNLRQFRIRAVLAGTVHLARGDRRVKASKNDLLIVPPGWQFRDVVPKRSDCCFLEIQMEAICSQGVPQHVFTRLDLPSVVPSADPKRLAAIAEACKGLAANSMSPRRRLLINPYLQELLTSYVLEGFRTGLLREKLSIPQWLYELRNLLDEEWKNNALNLEVLASRFKCSPSTLQHGFKQAFGTTISAYRIRQRIAMAVRILRLNPDLKAEAIARQCGYRSLSLFYRQFKQQTGCTPMDYHPRD